MTRREISTLNAGLVAAFLLVLAVGAAAAAVVLPVNQLTQPGGHVQIAAGELALERPAGLPAGTRVSPVEPVGAMWLEVSELPPHLRLLTEAGPAVGYLAWALGLTLVALVIRDIGQGRAFDARVPGRITMVAAVVLVGDIAVHAFDWLAADVVVDRLDAHGTVFPYPQVMPVASVVVAAFVLVVAEAFRQGRKMSAELEGLV